MRSLQHVLDHRLRHASKQGDALAQRRRELNLASHRPLGDGGDAVADPGEIRKFVDAFLADQRRVHIRDHEALPAMRERLDDDVDRLSLIALPSAARLAFRSPVKTRSAATPSSSQRRRSTPPRACAARSTVASLSGAFDGSAISVATRTDDMTLPDERAKHVRRALLIAGPTASGKSAAALALAQAFGATIVNADSMQVYRDLRILTARPTRDEERLAPHRLFGVDRRRGQFLRRTMGAGGARGCRGDRRNARLFSSAAPAYISAR